MAATSGILIADIGGTHARFAIAGGEGGWSDLAVVATRDHATLAGALAAWLGRLDRRPCAAVIAGAGPVDGGRIEMTNCPWTIDAAELAAAFGFASCRLVNDFEALAHAVPLLAPGDLARIGPATAPGPGPRLILGPGTGFGAAMHLATPAGGVVIPAEGGHLALGVSDVPGADVLGPEERVLGRLTIEAILSGEGIVRLHRAVCRAAGARAEGSDPAAVVEAADAQVPNAVRAIDLFCDLLGAAAGDLALATGARAGVYIAGGIAPRLVARLRDGGFRRRFDAKAPMEAYMRAIPVHVVVAPQPALTGLAGLARQAGLPR